ncbi:FapA family protein [Gracilibacillus sp. YIM 98692]|uniref:DUF342 domain-containing protein n=1 Tax=Gracilibacillus sp. YIM 98692 TaxID=2663532 RepID=UPI0013D87E8D|nr:FapA family protein [Gracilibacillus sp. YIM 98692]
MDAIKQILSMDISDDCLQAFIRLKDLDQLAAIKEDDIKSLIDSFNISYGIKQWKTMDWKAALEKDQSFLVAEGKPPVHGDDGKFILQVSVESSIEEEKKRNFRDVMQIPSVEEGDALGQIIAPTNGHAGIDIFQQPIKPIRGKEVRMKSGENVQFDHEDQIFYASCSGQLSINREIINVFPLFEVNGDVTLKTGNLDFIGSIVIKGNVPTGYQVTAKGDITVYGLVEAAHIQAGGSILIKEGIAGMDEAILKAGANVESTYINQAEVQAGQDIKVSKSIMHSNCVAQENILCQTGSVIGGTISAGHLIELGDVGNRANTKTELAFGVNKKLSEKVDSLEQERKQLIENEQKLKKLAEQLSLQKDINGELPPKQRIMLLKQRNMYNKTVERLKMIDEALQQLHVTIGHLSGMSLRVSGKAYENVELIFGKYKRLLTREYRSFQAYLDDKEIVIHSI